MSEGHLVEAPVAPGLPANPAEIIFDDRLFGRVEALARVMASGRSMVPAHFRGSVGDCMAVAMQAIRWRLDPFVVAQKTFLIEGVLGYEAQLVNAVLTTSTLLVGRPEFEWFGAWEKILGRFKEMESKKKTDAHGNPSKYRVPAWDIADEVGLGVRVSAQIKGEEKPRTLELLLTQARVRNSSLWADDPKQQLAYLAIKRWARLYLPDVLLGVYTVDELAEMPERDMGPAEVVVEPSGGSVAVEEVESALKAKLRAKASAEAPPPLSDLEVALRAIDMAGCEDDLDRAVKGPVAALTGDDVKIARKAFSTKRSALRALAQEAKAKGQAGATDSGAHNGSGPESVPRETSAEQVFDPNTGEITDLVDE
jgi:hypothetical protein